MSSATRILAVYCVMLVPLRFSLAAGDAGECKITLNFHPTNIDLPGVKRDPQVNELMQMPDSRLSDVLKLTDCTYETEKGSILHTSSAVSSPFTNK
jgi:hypothetical protein